MYFPLQKPIYVSDLLSEACSGDSICSQCSPVINMTVHSVLSRLLLSEKHCNCEEMGSVRSWIVILHKEKLSLHQMARLKVSKGAVQETLRRFAKTGSVFSKARSDRQKVTTPQGDQYNKLSSLRDRKVTPSQIQGDFLRGQTTSNHKAKCLEEIFANSWVWDILNWLNTDPGTAPFFGDMLYPLHLWRKGVMLQ